MQGEALDEGLLFFAGFHVEFFLERRQEKILPAVVFVAHNWGLQIHQVQANLVHAPRDGLALDEGVAREGFERSEVRFGRFALVGQARLAPGGAFDAAVYQLVVELRGAPHHGVVLLFHLAVLKLHGEVAVGFGVFGEGQRAAGFPVDAVSRLDIVVVLAG